GQQERRITVQREHAQPQEQRQARRDEQGMVRLRATERRLDTTEKNHIDWRAGEALPGPPVRERNPMSRLLQFNWLGVVDYIPALLQGLYYTLLISVVGLVIGFILGAIFWRGKISRSKILYGISAIYVDVLRGTPVLVQAIWIYFALPLIVGFNIPSLAAGIIVIGLNSGAYIAEIVRGAVQSVEKGQMEA